jgi:hypothetical protein
MSFIKTFSLLLLIGQGLGIAISPSLQDAKATFDKRDPACIPANMSPDAVSRHRSQFIVHTAKSNTSWKVIAQKRILQPEMNA